MEFDVRLVVIGDIHAQADKFWLILREAGLATENKQPTKALTQDATKLILLGDLFHAKTRDRYAALAQVGRYDEYNAKHLAKAEQAQMDFMHEVKEYYDAIPEGNIIILMGNHDFNAITPEQGPLRTDDIAHLEWKEGYGNPLDSVIQAWVETWPYEVNFSGIHFAHVGPLPKHNEYDENFYLENRRRWIHEDKNFFEGTPYVLGVYGHTPVRGGVNVVSQGRAILLDTNGHENEYVYLVIEADKDQYRLSMRGLFFDEIMPRP